MRDKTIAAIHDFTLKARDILQKEISDQLEGIYGSLPGGKLADSNKYPALEQLPEAKDTRVRVEQFFEDQRIAGLSPQEARDSLVTEGAFTWLNRLVAFKMMESRKLLRQTISKGVQSNGFLMWLTEPGNEEFYQKHEQGDLPQNALGEGPRQEAYRYFLLHQCSQLAQEIRVLFDPSNLASRLLPRPNVLRKIIDMMNAAELKEAWIPGNEETIGWVYQSFSSDELERAFREVRLSGKKFEAKDIPTVTHLFTPRWIVRYLVENTLGRLWLDMHPDSRLAEDLQYLVPSERNGGTPRLKPAREIRLLDPACGTMHFGLVAFDLFAKMYQEELERTGQQGWPEDASVASLEEIPSAIIANNLYGLDIDLLSVQLSALTLFLKAKSLNPKTRLTAANLVSAGIHVLDGNRLKEFLDEVGIKGPIYRRILSALQKQLADAEQLGSLLRLDEGIKALVEKEREHFEKQGRQLDIYGWSNKEFDTEAGKQEFWEILTAQIEQALNLFAKTQVEKGRDQSVFVGETIKGLRLMEVLSNSYEVVVTNPPYMSARKMNSRLKTLVSQGYPRAKGDLYAAFIQRCLELASAGGRVGMLTMHSFMFISSYEKLRDWIRGRAAIETLAHLGPALFSVGNPGTLQTAAHVLRIEQHSKKRQETLGTYFRLVREPDGDSKRSRFEEALERLRAGDEDPVIYRYRQGDFDAIPGSPWVYWITAGLRGLFEKLPKLADIAQPRQGLATADNFRFLRYWWEVGLQNIGFGYGNGRRAASSGKRWFPYMKGGTFRSWYGNQSYVVNWHSDGLEIKNLGIETGKIASRPQNTEFYFRRGVTWSDLTSGRFSARLSPGGFMFDVKGSSAFPEDVQLVLALLNSSFVQYALNLINPTVSFQVGDLSRLPIPPVSDNTLRNHVDEVVGLAKATSEGNETTYDFVSPPDWRTGIDEIAVRAKHAAEVEEQIDGEIYRLYGISDEDRKAIEAELAEARVEDSEADDECKQGETNSSEGDVTPVLTKEELARQWISYAVGVVLGRFEPGVQDGLGRSRFPDDVAGILRELADPDGIMVMDEGHPDDLSSKVLEALTVMVGEDDAGEIVRTATGKQGSAEDLLRQYLDRQFFKLHIQQYRKRPVYWFLQSPKKKYGVWLFHEKLTNDSLFRIRTEYVEPKIRLLDGQLSELKLKRDGAEGREKRRFEKEVDSVLEVLEDVREFSRLLGFIIEERGYRPHIDDGVLLNMAPLWELIPSWQAEPKKAWEALERGDYDWAYQAMDHWPDRVKEKCKTNKSFAIAHGLA